MDEIEELENSDSCSLTQTHEMHPPLGLVLFVWLEKHDFVVKNQKLKF